MKISVGLRLLGLTIARQTKLKINDPNPYPAIVSPETAPLLLGKYFHPQTTMKNIYYEQVACTPTQLTLQSSRSRL
jgi:hypothetical protein